jgi:hypothetical protein
MNSTFSKKIIAIFVATLGFTFVGLPNAGATSAASVFLSSSSSALANFANQATIDGDGNLWVVSNDNPASMLTKVAPDGTAVVAWAGTIPLPSSSSCTDSRNYGVAYSSGRIYWSCFDSAVYSISATAPLPVTTSDITLEVDMTGRGFNVQGIAVAGNGDIYMNNWDVRMFVHRAGDSVATATELFPGLNDGWIWPMTVGPDGNVYFVFDGDPSLNAVDRIMKIDVVGGSNAISTYWQDPLTSSSSNGLAFFPDSMTIAIVDFDASIGIRAIITNADGTGTLAPSSPLFSGDPLIGPGTGFALGPLDAAYVVISDAQQIHAVTKVTGIVDPLPTPPTSSTTSSTSASSTPVAPAFTG